MGFIMLRVISPIWKAQRKYVSRVQEREFWFDVKLLIERIRRPFDRECMR